MQANNGHSNGRPAGLRPRTVAQHDKPVSIIPYQGPDYYEAKSPEFVLNLIPDGVQRVLDVGCGAGNLGKLLKQRGVVEVVGIETCEAAAAEARTVLDAVYVGDIEAAALDYPAGYFDCIIYSGVLEHLRDPWFTLYEHRILLADTGTVVALVPNVQHYSVMLDLLRGNWRYRDAGILDATHYRFFTRNEVVRMFAETGFALDQLTGYTIGDPPPEAGRLGDSLQASGLATPEFVGDLQVYVWVGRAKKIAAWQPAGAAPHNGSATATAATPAIPGLPDPAVFLPGDEEPAPAPTNGASKPDATPQVSIIIPAWNQRDYTRMCIESVREFTSEPYEIIVVDNGSTDETAPWLATQADVRTITNAENQGFAVACNQGMEAARGAYLVLLNNDTVVTAGWATRLMAALDNNPNAGLAGPRSNKVGGRQMDPAAQYSDVEDMIRYAATLATDRTGDCEDLPWLSGFCWMLSRDTYDAIGGLDERFGVGTFEDNDYCKRVAMSGRRLIVAHDAFVHHHCSITFEAEGIDYQKQMLENKAVFEEKWADDPTYRGTVAYEAGDLPTATACFHEAIDATPDYADPYRNLAAVYLRQRNWFAAADVLARLCDLRPLQWDARVELGKACKRQGSLAAAAAAVQPALNERNMAPELRAEALVVAGDAAVCAAEWDMAEQAFRAAVTARDNLAGAWNGLGLVAHNAGRADDARMSFERAVKLDGAAPDPRSNLGVMAWKAGDVSHALEQFAAALDCDPLHADALDNYVAAALAEGRDGEAKHRVSAALALEPDWLHAQDLLDLCGAA